MSSEPTAENVYITTHSAAAAKKGARGAAPTGSMKIPRKGDLIRIPKKGEPSRIPKKKVSGVSVGVGEGEEGMSEADLGAGMVMGAVALPRMKLGGRAPSSSPHTSLVPQGVGLCVCCVCVCARLIYECNMARPYSQTVCVCVHVCVYVSFCVSLCFHEANAGGGISLCSLLCSRYVCMC